MQFIEELVDVKEYLVRDFYANIVHIIKGTMVTNVFNLMVKFDQCSLSAYFRLENVESKEYLAKLAEKENVRP